MANTYQKKKKKKRRTSRLHRKSVQIVTSEVSNGISPHYHVMLLSISYADLVVHLLNVFVLECCQSFMYYNHEYDGLETEETK